MIDRKDLINKLLKKPVTYSDIRKHKLSDNEISQLHRMDYITRREFVLLYRQLNSSDKNSAAAYIQWKRERERIFKSTSAELIKTNFVMYHRRGFDISRLNEGYKHHLPTREYFDSTHEYVSFFLNKVREEYYTNTISTTDAARVLGVSKRHLLRLVKQGKIKMCSESRRIRKNSMIDILKEQIVEKCNSLAEISPKHLDGLFNGIAVRLF